MRLIPLLVQRHRFRVGWLSFLAGVFPVLHGREDIRHLPPYLLRDIGLSEQTPPDWERLLR